MVDVIFPGRCLACAAQVERQGGLCPVCWNGLSFVMPPLCACCGLPFEVSSGAHTLCGACVADPPPFARARAVWRYDDASKPLILGFKHGDETFAAPAFGVWLARAGAELLADAECCIPVPLHRSRLRQRRYNQAALLARAVTRQSGVRFAPDWLKRRRATPSQAGRDRAARNRNVAGAFTVTDAGRRWLPGRRVVLIDDVFTTGATVSACAEVLVRAGAARVDVLALARVV